MACVKEAMSRNSEPVDFSDVEFVRETDRAYLLNIEDEEVWLPKSQVEEYDKESGCLVIPRWLAIEKGLIDD